MREDRVRFPRATGFSWGAWSLESSSCGRPEFESIIIFLGDEERSIEAAMGGGAERPVLRVNERDWARSAAKTN
jgi:hypothetical protein